MTSLTEENLQAVCDYLVTDANYKAAAASIGIGETTLYSWRVRCIADMKKNDTSSPFYICRRGEWMWWTAAVEASRREFFLSYTGTVMQQAKEGITTVVRDATQNVIYQKDPRFIGRPDSYVHEVLGLDLFEDVEPHHRLLKGPDGLPVPETRVEQIPAQLRQRVLEAASDEFKPSSHQTLDVAVTGSVVHEHKAIERPKEERVDLQELRRLAAMSAEERRAKFGAKPYAMDKDGRRTIPALAPPMGRDAPDDQGLGLRKPEPFVKPQQSAPAPDPGRPSYARPQKALDSAGTGAGNPPPGGFKVA